ncbi:MAG TPA: hypothetical protein VN704_02055 [Verrucomicrobiae bacterium]|nr:hypothetical protein [Verrucomicrobiae bacterium]
MTNARLNEEPFRYPANFLLLFGYISVLLSICEQTKGIGQGLVIQKFILFLITRSLA